MRNKDLEADILAGNYRCPQHGDICAVTHHDAEQPTADGVVHARARFACGLILHFSVGDAGAFDLKDEVRS